MSHLSLRRFLEILRYPEVLTELSLADWDVYLPIFSQLALLSHQVAVLDERGLSEKLPPRLYDHLESSRVRVRRHTDLVRWEVGQLDALLDDLGVPVVLLKGSAYLLSGLSPSLGRVYSDIDILVPKFAMQDVEQRLLNNEWEHVEGREDQEQYFRRWMHEILPLRHQRRASSIDLHHNVLPSIDTLQFDAQILLDDAVKVEDTTCIHTLSPVDMVLHSCIHLFRNGHYNRAIRDLTNLRLLLADFCRKERHFLNALGLRAQSLNLLTPCFLAFRYLEKYFAVSMPEPLVGVLRRGQPTWPLLVLLDQLFYYASFPAQITGSSRARRLAMWLMERYPPHLLRKSIVPKLERRGIFTLRPKH